MKIGLVFLIFMSYAQVQDKEAESATVPEGDLEFELIEEEEDLSYLIIMDYMDDLINVTGSQQDSNNSIGNQILTKAIENYNLFIDNQLLKAEITDLEAELIDSMEKLNKNRLDDSQKLENLAQEMVLLANFNEVIKNAKETQLNSLLESATYNIGEQIDAKINAQIEELKELQIELQQSLEGDDNDEDLEISHGFIYALGLSFLFILLFTLKSASDSLIFSGFSSGIYSLLVNLCILAGVLSVISLLYYYEVFEENDLYIETIYTGATLFSML